MTPTDILRAARAKVEAGWCRRAMARNAEGFMVLSTDDEACCWCMLGAIASTRMGDVKESFEAEEFIRVAIYDQNDGSIADWQDSPDRTKAEVLAAFDRAIELSEGKA